MWKIVLGKCKLIILKINFTMDLVYYIDIYIYIYIYKFNINTLVTYALFVFVILIIIGSTYPKNIKCIQIIKNA